MSPDKPEDDKPAEPAPSPTGVARPDPPAKGGDPAPLPSAYDTYHSQPNPVDVKAKASEDPDERARAKAEARAKEEADEAAEKEARAKAKAEARAKEEAEEAAEKEARAKAKAEARAKEEAEEEAQEAAEKKAKAEAKAKKEAEKQAEREREEKEEREREAREAAEALKKPPTAPPWYRTLRADPPAHLRLVLAIAMIAVVMGVWWFVTRGYDVQMAFNGRTKILELKVIASTDRIISVSKLPSPGEVFTSFDELYDRELIKHIVASLERVATGVGLAAFIGILLGVLAAAHRGVNAAVMPLVIFLRSVPMGALVPLTLMLFGDGEAQKSRFIFLAIVPFVFSDVVKAISVVPDRYIETAQTLGASRLQIVRKVLVPLALPDIITSLRFQLGLALGYIMLAEDIDTQYGIGKLISISQRQGLYDHVYMTLFVIAAIAFTLDYVLRTIQRGGFAWRKDL